MDNRGSSTTSTKTKDNINTTVQISAPTSKSSSAIPTSSPIPIAPAPAPAPPSSCNSKYSMEEVWKDICPSALLHQPTSTSSSAAALEGIVFQEFLSRPSRAQYDSTSRHHHHHHPGRHSSLESIDRGSFGSHSQGQPAPAATASITLSLNATRPPPSSSFSLPLDHDLDADANLNPPTVEFSILPEKRASQDEDTCHRNKRMIKNRESAARSRARKQAYTSELEIKVARLMEENAKLRRQQQEKHCLQQAPAPFPKKQMLCRTLTAPF